jgi:hypothetical protein
MTPTGEQGEGQEVRGEVRLVAMSAEDAARLRLIADHEGNDLSPNDHGLLLALADARFDSGITAEEADAMVDAMRAGISHRSQGDPDEACPSCSGQDKLQKAFA